MNADTGYGHMIFKRRLPAGLRASHHVSVPHLTAKPRGRYCPNNCGHPTLRKRQPACGKLTTRLEVGWCGGQTLSPVNDLPR